MAKKPASMKTQNMITDIFVHAFLVIVACVWMIPFVWLVAHSFRGESQGLFTPKFFPDFTKLTLDNYIKLFTEVDSMNFPPDVHEHLRHRRLRMYHLHLLRAGRFLLPVPSEVAHA